jgi:glycosyltransferase involved in cell wall biosynthesis
MASGLAVLAYETAAPAEYIEHGINGMLVPPTTKHRDCAHDYCETAWAVADQPHAWLRRMGEAARRTAQGAEWHRILGDFEYQLYSAALVRMGSNAQPCAI